MIALHKHVASYTDFAAAQSTANKTAIGDLFYAMEHLIHNMHNAYLHGFDFIKCCLR